VTYYNGLGEEMLDVFQVLDTAETLNSISHSGATAHATTASNHGYKIGDVVIIAVRLIRFTTAALRSSPKPPIRLTMP